MEDLRTWVLALMHAGPLFFSQLFPIVTPFDIDTFLMTVD